MGKKKHGRKNKTVCPFSAFGNLIDTLSTASMETGQGLSLGGGTVRTARITSKGISFCGRRHYNSDYIQKFCGMEVLIHEVGGKMKAYLYDETSKLLMRIICEVDISQVEMGNLVDGLSGSEASGRYSNW